MISPRIVPHILTIPATLVLVASLTTFSHAHKTTPTDTQTPTQEIFAKPPCNSSPGPTHTVVKVKDGRTLLLGDGTTVRLSGILPPTSPLSQNAGTRQTTNWPPEKNAITALTQLTEGRTVTLALTRPRKDRYGNLQAHIFLHNETSTPSIRPNETQNFPTWVQAHLLQYGHAQAYEASGQSDCFDQMLSIERKARHLNLGMWAHPFYQPIPSTSTKRLLKARGTYKRVIGRIKSVARRSTMTYLNFGTNWRTDFTIAVPRSVSRAHPNWAKVLPSLESRSIEVQGWIRARNGPLIELEHPAQLYIPDRHKHQKPERTSPQR